MEEVRRRRGGYEEDLGLNIDEEAPDVVVRGEGLLRAEGDAP